jgi:cytochrome c6
VSFGEITSFLKRILKETLEANGMNTISAISYQVINGKNGMPAFGGRLTEKKLKM